MANKKLGKGLNAIFGDEIDNFIDDINNNEQRTKGNSFNLKVNEVRPNPYQPRKEFDKEALNELAESIKVNGVIQPIVVRKSISGYELVAGERRLRASKIAGKKEIPAILVDFNDQQMMEISLLENIQREDLSPIEEANAYQQLLDKLKYTQQKLSDRVGKSREYIANILRLLKLPTEVQNLVSQGKLSYSQARAILSLNKEAHMIEVARTCVKEGLSVIELNKLIKQYNKDPKSVKPKQTNKKDAYAEDVRRQMEDMLGTSVKIGNKKIVISYTSTKDLNRILDILGVLDD